ncbi:UDP-glucose/GDP-mannose dehydrogenase family protein [bacterium]|nr:UDP-glucose/GDP-mannose dehydrogenase family protein [bacterium]
MRICVIGAGYVGLVTAVCVADFGHRVSCLDINEERIKALKMGKVPFYEPGLSELLEKNSAQARFVFTTDKKQAIEDAEVVYIAVGTPMNENDTTVDMTYIRQAAKDIAQFLARGAVVVDKSTVPVGTAREVKKLLLDNGAPSDIEVLSNPEFLREGTAVEDFKKPDRVIIGSDSKEAAMKLARVYKHLADEGRPFLFTSLEAAELTKYASNAFLAVKLTFINEIALLADKIGINALDVAKGIGMDNRIGNKFLSPGPGFGGSCLPKDTNGLLHIAENFGAKLSIVQTAVRTNDGIPDLLIQRLSDELGSLSGKKAGVLGLTFKGGTDDVRESPAIKLIKALLEHSVIVKAYDPEGERLARRELGDSIEYAHSEVEAIDGADFVIVATEWQQFSEMKPVEIARLMKGRVFADFRNLFDPVEMKKVGLKYIGMGRG